MQHLASEYQLLLSSLSLSLSPPPLSVSVYPSPAPLQGSQHCIQIAYPKCIVSKHDMSLWLRLANWPWSILSFLEEKTSIQDNQGQHVTDQDHRDLDKKTTTGHGVWRHLLWVKQCADMLKRYSGYCILTWMYKFTFSRKHQSIVKLRFWRLDDPSGLGYRPSPEAALKRFDPLKIITDLSRSLIDRHFIN